MNGASCHVYLLRYLGDSCSLLLLNNIEYLEKVLNRLHHPVAFFSLIIEQYEPIQL